MLSDVFFAPAAATMLAGTAVDVRKYMAEALAVPVGWSVATVSAAVARFLASDFEERVDALLALVEEHRDGDGGKDADDDDDDKELDQGEALVLLLHGLLHASSTMDS